MKKLFALLLAGCALLNVACKEKEEGENPLDRLIGTEPVYDEIFVQGDNGLVSAHQYIVNFTQKGGAVDLKIVSSGIRGDGQYVLDNFFGYELLDKMIDGNASELQIYDYFDQKVGPNGETVKKPRYIQTLRITAQPNTTGEQHEARIVISADAVDCWHYEIAQAYIFLRQAGAK